MTEFKAVSGGWTRPTETSMKGTVDASLSARCIAGAETDENIEFYATVKITTGKAALICNYTLDEDWNERYLEMVLDPTLDKVTLEKVIRDETGIETSRVTLASRNMSLATATEYDCRIVSKKLSDGAYAVYGYIDDFLLVEAEDLDANFQKGMHGLESLGTDGQYSEFKEIYLKTATYNTGLTRLKQILENTTETSSDIELLADSVTGYAEVNKFLKGKGIDVPLTADLDIAKEAEAYYAAAKFRGRRHTATSLKEAESFRAEAERILTAYAEAEGEITFKAV